MADPHLAVILNAIRADKRLRQLFARSIGTKEHPRGAILAAYRQARRALEGNLDNPAALRAILEQYRTEVVQAMTTGTQQAIQIGTEQAAGAIRAYSLPEVAPSAPAVVAEATQAVVGLVDNQILAIESGALTEAQVLGGRSRVGLFAAGAVQREAANWLANAAAMISQDMMTRSLTTGGVFGDFVRQAVAVVDERTTPCCLGVHGQIRDMNDDFYTPDPPAFASYQNRPPFHDYCRTSQVLVLSAVAEDDLTRDMREAADLELELREREDYKEPHPANAFTRIRS